MHERLESWGTRGRLLLTTSFLLFGPVPLGANPRSLGYSESTVIVPAPEGEVCPGTTLLQQDDGDFESGYNWHGAGVQPPDYGSWAERYTSDFVCGIQLLLTQEGFYDGQTMDLYVWESVAEGNPPPGPDPGNALCVIRDVDPGPPADWPSISTHDFQICCPTGGPHFVGFWPNWPGVFGAWYIAADENGAGDGCPRTKIAPGIGYDTGWSHPIGLFSHCRDLGIREHAGIGDCQATPSRRMTWGRIKGLY